MVERQFVACPAILARETISQKHVETGEGRVARRLDVGLQRDNRRKSHFEGRAAHHPIVFGDNVHPVHEDRLGRILP